MENHLSTQTYKEKLRVKNDEPLSEWREEIFNPQ